MPPIEYPLSLDDIIEQLSRAITFLFGGEIPIPILKVLVLFILAILLLVAINVAVTVTARIIQQVQEHFIPLIYNQEKRRRSRNRQRFATTLRERIKRQNFAEKWDDYWYTELEAEVEYEGRRSKGFWKILPIRLSGIERTNSLTKALNRSRERLILVEGEPGSGKSVALRHYALELAEKAERSRRISTLIPIYVNLKEMERSEDEPINGELIYKFVIKSLTRIHNRGVDIILEEEFDRGLEEGSWIFLFDSFDEIPEVLSSTESDAVVATYASAIHEFLLGLNRCRGIVASRHYRGPASLGWPLFRILPLSYQRQIDLIRRADLKPQDEALLITQFQNVPHSVYALAKNPMFLGLLSDYVRKNQELPSHPHLVYEAFISSRLQIDQNRFHTVFAVTDQQIRGAAERIAYVMAMQDGIGLQPKRSELTHLLTQHGLQLDAPSEDIFQALEQLQLAYTQYETLPTGERTFSFVHRRFQEYFATQYILKDMSSIPYDKLLTDGQWRESAVVILQTQPLDQIRQILNFAENLLQTHLNDLNTPAVAPEAYYMLTSPPQTLQQTLLQKMYYSSQDWPSKLQTQLNQLDVITVVLKRLHMPVPSLVIRRRQKLLELKGMLEVFSEPDATTNYFIMPPKLLHLLSILQDGLINRIQEVPEKLRNLVDTLLLSSLEKGQLIDIIPSVEYSGISSDQILTHAVRRSLRSSSTTFQNVAYKQVGYLSSVPDDITEWIRRSLLSKSDEGILTKEISSLRAYFHRLSNSSLFLSSAFLLTSSRWIDLLFVIGAILGSALWIRGLLQVETNSWFLETSRWTVGLFMAYWLHLLLFPHAGFRRLYFYLLTDPRSTPVTLPILAVIFRLLIPLSLLISLTITMQGMNAVPETQYLGVIFALFFYIMIWAVTVRVFVVSGRFTSISWWPFYPFLLLPYLISRHIAKLTKHVQMIRTTPELLLTWYLGVLVSEFLTLMLAALGTAILYAATHIIIESQSLVASAVSNSTGLTLDGIDLLGFTVLFWLLPVLIIQRLSIYAMRLSDQRRWKNLGTRLISTETFLLIFVTTRHNNVNDYLKFIYQRKLLHPNTKNLSLVRELSLLVEKCRRFHGNKKQYDAFFDKISAALTSAELVALLQRKPKLAMKFKSYDASSLDTLALIHRQLTAQVTSQQPLTDGTSIDTPAQSRPLMIT